jgi:hypothetical protein
LKDIERRLAEHEPLLRERDQLEAALSQPPFAAAAARPAAKRAPSAPRKVSKRAPRGANREAILNVVGERPGVSATEISQVTKIARPVTYNTLAKLVEQGKLEKTELPGGQTGYRTATPAESQPGL